jgi:hypothetical protein
MKPKHWLAVGLVMPIIVLIGWLLSEQILIWAMPAPRWVNQKKISTNICVEIVPQALDNVEAEPDVRAARITPAQADDIMERMLARQSGFVPYSKPDSPHLAWATFPDGQRRLFWYEAVLVAFDGSMSGKAAATCLDAATGEPLMLIPDVPIGDPCMTCGCIAINLPLRRPQFVALGLLVIYLFFLAIGVGAFWVWRRYGISR